MTSDVIARLAAANPVPAPAAAPAAHRFEPRRAVLALAAAAAVAVPTAAFADRLGDLLGLSNPGAPEPTSSLYLSRDTKMNEAMQSMAFPSTLQLLGTVNGVSFYASRRADGHYCFAIEKGGDRGGVSCDLDGRFPSPATPVWIFPPHDGFNGFAADGVSTVEGLDASGRLVVSTPVTDNVFAAPPADYTNVARVEALDANGGVIWTWHLPDR